MTPAPPPPDDTIKVAGSASGDQDSLDAEFEQELEDLFSEEMDEPAASPSDDMEPMILDDVVDGLDDDLGLDVVEETPEEDILVLDEVLDDDEEGILLLEEVVEEGGVPELDDAQEDPAQDLLSADDDLADLDDLLSASDNEPELPDLPEDILDEAAVSQTVEEDLSGMTDLLDGTMPEADLPEPEAAEPDETEIPDDLADLLAEPEADSPEPVQEPAQEPDIPEDMADLLGEPEPEPESGLDSIADGMADMITEISPEATKEDAAEEAATDEGIADLVGLESLDEDEDLEDMDSLLDNVDVSGIMDEPANEGGACVTATGESCAGSDEVDDLQTRVIELEARVETLESYISEQVAKLVPAEAARIIREEIAALAQELDG